jgi:hypothetical protein
MASLCLHGELVAANAAEDIFGFEQTAATIRKACAKVYLRRR